MMLFSYDRGATHQYAGWSQRKSVSIDIDGIVYRRHYVIGKEDEARTVQFIPLCRDRISI